MFHNTENWHTWQYFQKKNFFVVFFLHWIFYNRNANMKSNLRESMTLSNIQNASPNLSVSCTIRLSKYFLPHMPKQSALTDQITTNLEKIHWRTERYKVPFIDLASPISSSLNNCCPRITINYRLSFIMWLKMWLKYGLTLRHWKTIALSVSLTLYVFVWVLWQISHLFDRLLTVGEPNKT